MKKTRNTRFSLSIATVSPRNPLVAAARFRHAGMHRPGGHALRQQARRAMQREVENLHPPHP